MLFVAYINTLPDKIESSGIFSFADDNKLFRNIESDSNVLLLQGDIDNKSTTPGQQIHCSASIQINFIQ